MNKQGVTKDMVKDIEEFHPTTQVFQLPEVNNPEYGFTSLENVYTQDQVPIGLCSSYSTTVEDKGADEVYDATSTDKEIKRFCTLNLAAPLARRANG